MRARINGQKVVVCLPFPVEMVAGASSHSIATSWSTADRFLKDIGSLAKNNADILFIIRGKNSDWVGLPALSVIVEELRSHHNVVLDIDYSELNRTYLLCTHADAAIAQPTSLADELLSKDIPCILFDYSHNSSGMYRPLFAHLPDPLWAYDFSRLANRLSLVLAADSHFFQKWWEPYRDLLYGSWNDGSVRVRARATIKHMLAAPSGRLRRSEGPVDPTPAM
jgi:hypothetical protein